MKGAVARLAPDLAAGVAVAGLLIPEAIAYASIAGLPPAAGIVALLAGLLSYGFIGRSRFAVVSATSSSAALLAATIASTGGGQSAALALAAGLVLITGLFFLAAGAARLGALSSFVAKPVLRGYAFGLALVIIARQIPKLSGLAPRGSVLGLQLLDQLGNLAHWNRTSAALGGGALAALVLLRHWRAVPVSLAVVAAGILAESYGGLSHLGVSIVGPIGLHFAAPRLPALDEASWFRLAELAFAMVFILYAESFSTVRSLALRHGDGYFPNRELLALGCSNLISGLLQGMPVGAGFSASSANEAAGARSRVAGWIAGAVVLAIVGSVLPLISRTPEPVLGAVIIYAVSHTVRLEAFRPYFRWRRDRFVSLAALLAVLILGVLDGLLVAVAVSLLMTLRELAEPRLSELGRMGQGHDFVALSAHPEASRIPGILIFRPEVPLFFANVERVFGRIHQRLGALGASSAQALVLSLEESPDLDGTSIEALAEFAAWVRSQGLVLVLARLKEPAIEVLQRAAIPDLPAAALTHWSVDDAVAVAAEREPWSGASRPPSGGV